MIIIMVILVIIMMMTMVIRALSMKLNVGHLTILVMDPSCSWVRCWIVSPMERKVQRPL